ncbi:MAG: hypothetical protein M3209_13240 [Acidobacteriota bacterium]|nr:hypothetical protein [Acidobacteriota bacterium]
MKRCPQCQQTFSDENNFCLSDGTPLVPALNVPDQSTIIKPVPPVQPMRPSTVPVFAYIIVSLLVLLIGGGFVLWIVRDRFLPGKSDSNNSPVIKKENKASNFNDSKTNQEQDRINEQKANLQAKQEALEKEKQKLAEERNKLNAQKNSSNQTTAFNQTPSLSQPTMRIKFRSGSVGETVSGSIGAERSFVLYTLSGQYLSANVNSGNGCVVFRNGSTSTSFVTSRGDTYLYLKNNCGETASFSLTVTVR